MKVSATISLAIIGCSAGFFVVSAILMQEVRAKLVSLLVQGGHPVGTEISDWSAIGGSPPGYYSAIKKEFIWGARAKELLLVRGASPLLLKAKVLYVIREVARVTWFCGFVSLLWVAFSST